MNVIYVYSKTDSKAEGQTVIKDKGNKGKWANNATLPYSSRYGSHINALGNNTNSLNPTNSSTNNQLLKTGSEKKAQLAVIALGLITLTNALALLWAKIKKFSK